MRTAQVIVYDMNLGLALQAYQLDGGPEWHVGSRDWSGLCIASSKAQLCRFIAQAVKKLPYFSIETTQGLHQPSRLSVHYSVHPDEMGCSDIDGEYLGFAETLRKIVPETIVETLPLDVSN